MARQWGAMAAARRIIALSVDADQRLALVEISRSRTEPANRGERARIILAYLEEPSAYAVACAMRVSQQTVTRCLERAAELGVLAALDDRARPGRDARITVEARTWLVGLACAKPTQFGYPHELWPTVCWPRMRAITDRAPAIQAWQTWPRERCARSSPR